MKTIRKIINDFWQTRREVKELSRNMSEDEIIKVMREYNNLVYGGTDVD